MDAAGGLAQLLQRAGGLRDGAGKLRAQLAWFGRGGRLRRAQVQGEGDEPLLGAVVQVPFDPPPRLVGGGHDPRPGGRQRSLALCVGDRGCDQLGEPGQSVPQRQPGSAP